MPLGKDGNIPAYQRFFGNFALEKYKDQTVVALEKILEIIPCFRNMRTESDSEDIPTIALRYRDKIFARGYDALSKIRMSINPKHIMPIDAAFNA